MFGLRFAGSMGISVYTGRVCVRPVDSIVGDVTDVAANVHSTSAVREIKGASCRDFPILTGDDDNVIAVMVYVSIKILSDSDFPRLCDKGNLHLFRLQPEIWPVAPHECNIRHKYTFNLFIFS